MRNLLIAGNTMMPSCIGVFNLPPLQTCTPSKWCRKHCYALYGRHIWKNVEASQQWRYEQSLKSNFVSKMVGEINRRKSIQFIRIHLAGDFYSKEYIKKWANIAEAIPNKIFRTNTKRLDFIYYMKKYFPSNIVIRESLDITRKGKGIFPYAAIEGTPGSDNYFWCIDDCAKCGFYCFYNPKDNIVFRQLR